MFTKSLGGAALGRPGLQPEKKSLGLLPLIGCLYFKEFCANGVYTKLINQLHANWVELSFPTQATLSF